VRPHGLDISGNVDRYVFRLVGLQIVELDGPELLNHNGVGSG
jgi:hypothetical protein